MDLALLPSILSFGLARALAWVTIKFWCHCQGLDILGTHLFVRIYISFLLIFNFFYFYFLQFSLLYIVIFVVRIVIDFTFNLWSFLGFLYMKLVDLLSAMTTSLEALHPKVDSFMSRIENLWKNTCSLHSINQTT